MLLYDVHHGFIAVCVDVCSRLRGIGAAVARLRFTEGSGRASARSSSECANEPRPGSAAAHALVRCSVVPRARHSQSGDVLRGVGNFAERRMGRRRGWHAAALEWLSVDGRGFRD